MTCDVAIAGGGIVGAACAFACARAGLSVVVVEQAFPSGGATAAGMGHIVVMDDSEAQFALTRYSSALWAELAAELPQSVEYLPCGTIWVAADEEEMREVHRKARFYSKRGVAVEILDARQLAEAEPHLRPGLAGGLLVPGDSVIYPPSATAYLLASPQITRQAARVLRIADGELLLSDGTTISAGVIINATGTAAALLTPQLPVPIQPRKGHLVITDRYPGYLHHQLVELGYLKSAHSSTVDSVAFNVQPRKSGQILIGSSRQYGAQDSTVDRTILSNMLARAAEYMPNLAHWSAIRCWTGFRAATPDKLPVIGLCPSYERVYVAAGHEGLGITTSLATGELVADRILRRASAIPYEPYLPERCLQPCLA